MVGGVLRTYNDSIWGYRPWLTATPPPLSVGFVHVIDEVRMRRDWSSGNSHPGPDVD